MYVVVLYVPILFYNQSVNDVMREEMFDLARTFSCIFDDNFSKKILFKTCNNILGFLLGYLVKTVPATCLILLACHPDTSDIISLRLLINLSGLSIKQEHRSSLLVRGITVNVDTFRLILTLKL